MCVSVLGVTSGPGVKLAGCRGVLNPPVICSIDHSGAMVLVLFLLFVVFCSFLFFLCVLLCWHCGRRLRRMPALLSVLLVVLWC